MAKRMKNMWMLWVALDQEPLAVAKGVAAEQPDRPVTDG